MREEALRKSKLQIAAQISHLQDPPPPVKRGKWKLALRNKDGRLQVRFGLRHEGENRIEREERKASLREGLPHKKRKVFVPCDAGAAPRWTSNSRADH